MAGWPVNSFITNRSIRIQKGVLAARDKRMGVLNELIGAVKFIKFFAWEERWIQRALDSRKFEIKWLVKSRINSVLFTALWTSAPILVSIISFFTFVAQGNELTVSTAFTSIALFNMIRTPLNVIPTWIVQILQTKVALDRISTYIEEDEVSDQVSTLKKSRSGPTSPGAGDDTGLGIENGSFKWNEVEEVPEQPMAKDSDQTSTSNIDTDTAVETQSIRSDLTDHRFELRNISVTYPEGQLTCITGPTASGKTALLMATLGEMTTLSGRLIMSKDPSKVDQHGLMHSMSYSAQSPWLRHQSIRDNILFGYPYDEERYNAVVECCALNPDLNIFEDGDATEIGARGVSLSGGQKARVALARAVYARTKYVLLDDPLSAVDSHTARFLFDRLFRGPLLANRTVVLVTHHVELVLPGTHYLIRMLDGRIDTQGTVKELRAQGVLDDITHDSAVLVEEKEVSGPIVPADGEAPADDAAKGPEESKKPRKLIKDEHRETGGVKWTIYKAYLKASSYWTWTFLCGIVVLSQLLGVTEKLWIKTWGEAYGEANRAPAPYTFTSFATGADEIPMHGAFSPHSFMGTFRPIQGIFGIEWPSAYEHPLFYIGVYSLIGLATALASITSTIVQYTGALRASRLLFKQLLVGVVRATMRWHGK
jgi:ABC-type multidrug transport system fused ATPase/permease subunit